MDMTTANGRSDELLFDWKLDVERLEREARVATRTREPNDWALVEAECSKDLIEAELKAIEARRPQGGTDDRTVEHLKAWQTRVDRVIRQLRSL